MSDPVIQSFLTEDCHLAPDARQPALRKGIQELLASIRDGSQLVPGIVTPHPTLPPPHMLILDGGGRWWCLDQLKKPFLAIVHPTLLTDAERRAFRLKTNAIREGMTPAELAADFMAIMEEEGLNQVELSVKIGMNQTRISRALKYNLLCPAVRPHFDEGRIPPSFIEYIAKLARPEDQIKAADSVINGGLNRDQLILFCKRQAGDIDSKPKKLQGKSNGRNVSIGVGDKETGKEIADALEELAKKFRKHSDVPARKLDFLL